ncbi:MAG: ROK family protein, partial [Chitinophagaceae bacterium]
MLHSSKLAIGIDIGGTTTKFGIVNNHGEILEQDRVLTNTHEKVDDFIEELSGKLTPMIARHGGFDAFKGIGMGAPNGNFYTGTIEYAPNLRWKGVVPIARMMEEKFKLPTFLTNDANA